MTYITQRGTVVPVQATLTAVYLSRLISREEFTPLVETMPCGNKVIIGSYQGLIELVKAAVAAGGELPCPCGDERHVAFAVGEACRKAQQ